jgi:hypothetical protein
VFDTVAEARALEKKTMDLDRTNDHEGERTCKPLVLSIPHREQ